MNGELLAALESLEREKGISKEVLCAAIESAIASAAFKIIGCDEAGREEITVEMDRDSGKITVFNGDEEVDSEQFGRIAAQTAKQVMIQKIREAERDVVFDKYYDRVGEIVSGAVHRFEKGNIIVEMDDTEAVLPKSEQIPREKFRQGEVIRALLLDVDRKSGSLDLILSRSNSGFVKKLFELEVPEISQGIVEIHAIAREAGDRSKIAVYSKDERIDAVGACVGMRGARVKEVVQELSGERIDIVRWSDDIHEYVQAAVSPVELYSMEVDRANEEIRVAVTKDQLALLIGKKGRNIRLASKLVGWDIKADTVMESMNIPLNVVIGLQEDEIKLLEGAGFTNATQILEAFASELPDIPEIGEDRLREIVASCESAVETVLNTQAESSNRSEEEEEEHYSVEEPAAQEKDDDLEDAVLSSDENSGSGGETAAPEDEESDGPDPDEKDEPEAEETADEEADPEEEDAEGHEPEVQDEPAGEEPAADEEDKKE